MKKKKAALAAGLVILMSFLDLPFHVCLAADPLADKALSKCRAESKYDNNVITVDNYFGLALKDRNIFILAPSSSIVWAYAEDPLNPTDKLNGIKWKGDIYMTVKGKYQEYEVTKKETADYYPDWEDISKWSPGEGDGNDWIINCRVVFANNSIDTEFKITTNNLANAAAYMAAHYRRYKESRNIPPGWK